MSLSKITLFSTLIIICFLVLSLKYSLFSEKSYVFLPIAMYSEAQPFVEKLENVVEKKISGFDVYFGKYNNIDMIVGVSRVGSINMSGLMYTILSKYSIKFILNFGVVGGIGESIHKGDLVVVTHNLNTNSYRTKKAGKGEGIKVENIEYLTFDEDKIELVILETDKELVNKLKNIKMEDSNIFYGGIGSGDMWNQEYDQLMYVHTNYDILCEDMEAAAVYQVSEKYKIPHISLKGVSDNAILDESYELDVMGVLISFVEKAIEKLI